MIRDAEINRLIRYAQGMGLSVRFKPYIKNSKTAAIWVCDGSEITIYVKSNCSKLDKVLSLIHELAHHKSWVDNNRELDPKIEEALDASEGDEVKKSFRKRLWDMETKDAEHWEQIYRDTNCQFDIRKLHRQKEFDLWCYEFHYETGRDAKKQEKIEKMKELRKKYGC